MKACAESGGVVGINGIGIFLGDLQTRTESMVATLIMRFSSSVPTTSALAWITRLIPPFVWAT